MRDTEGVARCYLASYQLSADSVGEVWINPDGSSFAVIARRADGMACLAMGGLQWQAIAPPKPLPAGVPG